MNRPVCCCVKTKGLSGLVEQSQKKLIIVSTVLALFLLAPSFLNVYTPAQPQLIDDRLLSAYIYLNSTCADLIYGGHYRQTNRMGTPTMTTKHANMEGAIIRAVTNYYNYSGDTQALQHAIDTFDIIEAYMRNPSHTYNSRMTHDWSSSIISNSRTIDNCNIIRGLVELYKQTGNNTYYHTAARLLYFIRDYQRDGVYGGYHLEVDGSGIPNSAYLPWGYLPGHVALACGSLLSVDPTNATFFDELNYALNFAQTRYWDTSYGGYCESYTSSGGIYQSNKPLHIQSIMLHAFTTGYMYTSNSNHLNHAEDIANLLLNHWTDSGFAFVMDVNQDLSHANTNRNSVYLANAADAFLELYFTTANTNHLAAAESAMSFIYNYHYDPIYLGFFSTCDVDGVPIDSDKSPMYNAFILSAMLRFDLSQLPPPTTPTNPTQVILQMITIIGGTIIIVLVLVLVIMLTQKRRKPVKHSGSYKSIQLPKLVDSSRPLSVRSCATCGGQIKPNDRFCAGCSTGV